MSLEVFVIKFYASLPSSNGKKSIVQMAYVPRFDTTGVTIPAVESPSTYQLERINAPHPSDGCDYQIWKSLGLNRTAFKMKQALEKLLWRHTSFGINLIWACLDSLLLKLHRKSNWECLILSFSLPTLADSIFILRIWCWQCWSTLYCKHWLL